MKFCLKAVLSLLFAVLSLQTAFAQTRFTAIIMDTEYEVVPFATVSLTPQGAKEPSNFVLSDENGSVVMPKVSKGKYTLKVDLMGYKSYSKEIEMPKDYNFGPVILELDREVLDAASVSAVGNPIIIKKDTVEYNASSFKTTENDVLEDLLKKLPGVEINDDGSITANGQTINKIEIDGKTFFLDDPQLASKNIPAKIVDKVKVIERMSEQSRFSGIDDGDHEYVIDLSVQKGMMNGLFGSFNAGAGKDAPGASSAMDDYRYQAGGFVGKFTEKTQVSVLLNANNTNNRGFNDLSGGMMGGMMGGGFGGGFGGRDGVSTSYMGGSNIASTLFDDAMKLSGNYLFNSNERQTQNYSTKETYLDDMTLVSRSGDKENRNTNIYGSQGHRMGLRLEHKFSENTTLLFEPRINFGTGSYSNKSFTETLTRHKDGVEEMTNKSDIHGDGANKNLSTSGFLLLRQRLGKPGRTLTLMSRYSYSDNELDGRNNSVTTTFADGMAQDVINQEFKSIQNSYSLMGRGTYTEPLAKNFFAEANYSYSWNKSVSDKKTYDSASKELVADYSNAVTNENVNQEIGANLLYQTDKMRAQLGFAAKPLKTHNYTANGSGYRVDTTRNVVNWSPQANLFWDIDDHKNVRIFYRGNSSQPSISRLISVPDNSNPLSLSFGNPSLAPSFNHNVNVEYRFNNRQSFTSMNIRFNASLNENPIVNSTWYTNGISYSMPVNGPSSSNAGVNMFLNTPIAKSNFSISNTARVNFSKSSSFVGTNISTESVVKDGALDYPAFFATYGGDNFDTYFAENQVTSWGLTERLRVTYRNDDLEIAVSGRTRLNIADYTLATTMDHTQTWANVANATLNWTIPQIGVTIKSDYDFRWYRGYVTPQDDEHILNAEIQKMFLHNAMTLALKAYDIFEQTKNLSVSDTGNYHTESVNNNLGRYVILSLTFRFGNFGGKRGPGGFGGPMGGPGGFRR